jgi:serine protease
MKPSSLPAPIARRLPRFGLVALAVLWSACGVAAEWNPARHAPEQELVTRVIVKLKNDARAQAQSTAAGESASAPAAGTAGARLQELGVRSRVSMRFSHSITSRMHVARLLIAQNGAQLDATLAALRADPAVEYADPDRRRHALAIPNDSIFFYPSTYVTSSGGTAVGQWYLQAPQPTTHGTTTAAVNAVAAWDVSKGGGIVIADLDTGIRLDHPDLKTVANGGKVLPGADFVGPDGGQSPTSSSTYKIANDGNGWDTDPSDPGDWVSATDFNDSLFKGSDCGAGVNTPTDSSWHGTRTAGILAALTNNATGIAGIGWNAQLLPVRVLGKCGGYDSDIISGMLWAAGVTVTNAPLVNNTPARVINMSLGGTSPTCSASYQDAVSQVVAKNAVIVVSAGNEGSLVDEPANCAGAIGVTGVRHVGTKVGFANLGPGVALAAPAGNCVNTAANSPCLFSIDTTTNLGLTTPGTNDYTDQLNANVGTSFSAPIVSGIAALIMSANPQLKPGQVSARLQASARAFPYFPTDDSGAPLPQCRVASTASDTQSIECNCTAGTCGAGLADAGRALAAITTPVAAIAISGTVNAGQPVQLDGTASSGGVGGSVATYQWSLAAGAGATFSAPTAATTQLTLPSTGAISAQLIVTDTNGGASVAAVRPILSVVPDVTGQTQAAAGQALTAANLEVGTLTTQASATVASGSVISQSPVAGTTVASGKGVVLVVSSGAPTQVAVPNVVGQTQTAATNAITAAGLAVGTITQQSSTTVASGTVISESPAAGTQVASGSSVSLVVSSGPPPSSGGGGGGGGGGAFDAGTLSLAALLGTLSAWGRRRRAVARTTER